MPRLPSHFTQPALMVMLSSCATTPTAGPTPAPATPPAGTPATVPSPLAWLIGCWSGPTPTGSTWEECWAEAAPGRFEGRAREVEGGRETFSETLRIEAEGEGIRYLAGLPSGREALFTGGHGPGQSFAVTDPANSFPRTIQYRLTEAGVYVDLLGADGEGYGWTLAPVAPLASP